MWEKLFTLTNLWALVGWAMLAFLPRRPAILSGIMYLVVGLLCAAYAAFFAMLLSGSVDPGAAPNAPDTPLNLTTLAGVMALFDTKAGAVIGWTHYLAFDLFVGLWIARDADSKGIGRLWQLPFLFFALMVGPVGLLLWLAFREPRARAEARRRAAA
jgi:hypothetical protein